MNSKQYMSNEEYTITDIMFMTGLSRHMVYKYIRLGRLYAYKKGINI